MRCGRGRLLAPDTAEAVGWLPSRRSQQKRCGAMLPNSRSRTDQEAGNESRPWLAWVGVFAARSALRMIRPGGPRRVPKLLVVTVSRVCTRTAACQFGLAWGRQCRACGPTGSPGPPWLSPARAWHRPALRLSDAWIRPSRPRRRLISRLASSTSFRDPRLELPPPLGVRPFAPDRVQIEPSSPSRPRAGSRWLGPIQRGRGFPSQV